MADGTPFLEAIEFVEIQQSWWKPCRRWDPTFAQPDDDHKATRHIQTGLKIS